MAEPGAVEPKVEDTAFEDMREPARTSEVPGGRRPYLQYTRSLITGSL